MLMRIPSSSCPTSAVSTSPPPSPGLVWWGGVSGVRGAHDSPVILPLILRDIPPLSLPQVVGKLSLP